MEKKNRGEKTHLLPPRKKGKKERQLLAIIKKKNENFVHHPGWVGKKTSPQANVKVKEAAKITREEEKKKIEFRQEEDHWLQR